ncbi:hypothetical protein IKZ77_02605 [Candidatus Saccharibacteria bacterium]|nr:hypothetical protein [Candidatus Saccharibacteria bacterium]
MAEEKTEKKKGGKGKFFLGAALGAVAGVFAGRAIAKKAKENEECDDCDDECECGADCECGDDCKCDKKEKAEKAEKTEKKSTKKAE